MTGEHLDAVGQLEKPADGVEEALRALHRAHGEIGAGRVADEERISGEDEPRLVRSRRVDHGQAAVLRPVPGRMDAAHPHASDRDLIPVVERIVRIHDRGCRMDAHGNPMVERQAAVTGDVVRVSVRLDDADDSSAEPVGLGENRLDRERGVDDDQFLGLLAPDEIRGAPEIVVQDL